METEKLIPGDVHPGEFILNELNGRKMSQQELAEGLRINKSIVSQIINGKRKVNVSIAIKLERILAIKAEYWMSLQIKYDIKHFQKRKRNKKTGVKHI